ncbi:uncharacterized protein MONBRDRAFT_36000 [Monosiga brevicollis MX1]|uniref:BZIP domain-containing protein n=1 Tax=Monosiga brevicollis TaxID=81824 RepID=A9UR93_MONBE|nr:uncharacterized protein MONBRDRAFT_36000 [Monosiga brevicollis MX1]EDQ91885.1 predicted protein [Monosiga brevicollis MX1]|eukprot:XP_001743171.1 hypothetical protein [Monosiga brevicollis MX1]
MWGGGAWNSAASSPTTTSTSNPLLNHLDLQVYHPSPSQLSAAAGAEGAVVGTTAGEGGFPFLPFALYSPSSSASSPLATNNVASLLRAKIAEMQRGAAIASFQHSQESMFHPSSRLRLSSTDDIATTGEEQLMQPSPFSGRRSGSGASRASVTNGSGFDSASSHAATGGAAGWAADLLTVNQDDLFRMLQEADPSLSVPHLSTIEGLNIEVSHSVNVDDLPTASGHTFDGFLQAINLASSVQPRDERTSDLLQPVVAISAALDDDTYRLMPMKQLFKGVGSEMGSTTSGSDTSSQPNTPLSFMTEHSGKRGSHSMSELDFKRKKLGSKRKPERDAFDSEEAFSLAWQEWRSVRQKNNAAVHKSRQKAKARRAVDRHAAREKERKAAQLAMEAEMLRKNVDVLIKAVRTPDTLTPIERAWVQTLSHSSTGPTLAGQCALYS